MLKHHMLRAFSLLFTSLVCTVFLASVANAKSNRGETYSCFFPKAGNVQIDTRRPNSSIIYKGKRYAARGGSYFFQTESDITLAFNPSMTQWTIMLFSGDDAKSEKSTRCSKVRNRR